MASNNCVSIIAMLISVGMAVSHSGCGGGTPPPPIIVSVSATTATTLQAGATANFSAIVENDLGNKGVTWKVSCSAAQCGSVSPTATLSGASVTYTAPTTPPSGDLKVTITATSAADTTKSAAATATVLAITLSATPTTATVQVGGSAQFSASANNDPASAGVNWTVSCATSPCGTVLPTSALNDVAVTYTAPGSPPASNLTVTLTATSVTDNTKSASVTVTIPSVAVSVTPASATVLEGGTIKVTATVAGDSASKGVTWSVSCSSSPCGSVSPTSTASGVAATYTAPGPPPSDLQVSVTATSVANSLAMASAAVTVPAVTVDVEPPGATVEATMTAQFTATVSNDPDNKGVTWAVSCSETSCGTVSPTATQSGAAVTYTAPGTPPPSDLTVTLSATSVTDSTKSSSVNVTVPAIRVSAVSPSSGLIPVNATQDFTATIDNDPTNAGVNWTLTQNGTACSPACGTVSAATTASGAPTTYAAPATVPANATVTLNAIAAADTTKSSTATITLTNGTVKLIPASVDFGRVKVQTPPLHPTRTVALTNTGGAALTINNIAITPGTNSTEFSQTNDCPASVDAGGSCTISVTFTVTIVGSASGSLSISDSSPDSPQNVALSGTGFRIRVRFEAAVRSDLAGMTSASAPAPTGPEIVGTSIMHLTDHVREDPYLNNGTKRELAVRLWYPATLRSTQDCAPAAYTSPAVWNYFAEIVGVRPFPVKTNSCWEAPVAAGRHPVVVFTPGFTSTFTDYTFLMEDLASRGYVVAAVAHTYETTAVELGDGRLAKSVLGSHLGGLMQGDDRSLSTAVYARLLDLKSVVNELERSNARRDSAFLSKLELSKIAVVGHSLGGLTALLGIELEPRLKTAILMDGFLPEALPSATKKPVLILAAGRERWEPAECRLWNNLEGPRLAVNLRGAEHVALGDWIWLARDSVQTGPMGPDKTLAAVRDYVAAFLDANLRGVTLDPEKEMLLNGTSSNYPDAVVTKQGQPLCARH